MSRQLHFLIDMDGVIADWGKQWDHVLNTFWPDSRAPRHHQQTTFDLKAGLDEYDCDVVSMAMKHPNFYRDLEPIEGAATALHQMVDAGHTVTICTSPWLPNETCVQDKLWWLEAHIGKGWAGRAVITSDKTRVRGDFLIDDKPDIHGAYIPEWEHIVFDQPYNQDVTGKQRLHRWVDWSEVLFGVTV